MANGQTILGGGFDPRFRQAPIVGGQPIGAVPGENVSTLGQGVFSNVRPPEKPLAPQLAKDDPRKMAQDLADIQGNISIKIGQLFRAAKRDPALAANLRGATITLMRELAKTRDLRKDALSLAGLPTAKADIDFERVAAKIPDIPFITQTIKDEERLVGGPRGQPPEVLIPARRTIPQGAVESTGGVAGVRGQPIQTKADTKVVQARDEDGNIVSLLVSKTDGTVIAELGRGPELRFEPQTVPGVGREELAKLDEAEIGVTNAIQGAFDLRTAILEGGEAALAAPGALAGLIQGAVSQFIGFAQLAGIDTTVFESGARTDTAAQKGESIFAEIDKAGRINAENRSAIVNLAFAAAAASGQTGRGVSDRDYERFVRELGAGIGRPEVFAGVLTKFAKRLGSNFTNRFKVKMRRIPGREKETAPDLFKEIFGAPGTSAAPAGVTAGQGARASSLAEGTTATNPNGQRLVVRGGKWVSQ